jgi:hypothetical protein
MIWIVKIEKGYTSITFEFDECKEAMVFVEMAIKHLEEDIMSDVNLETCISICKEEN